MNSHDGCFSPYLLISSTLQTIFGFDRRSEQEIQADLAEQHQIELRRMKDDFQDQLEKQKIADMRAKMMLARKYRCEEKFEQTVLQHKTEELRKFFMDYLPIKRKCVATLIEEAEKYKSLGYDSRCSLNVILLHTRQKEIDYNEICDSLDKAALSLGNIVYRRWCDKDVAHNSGILNLHAVMGNIPTVVISPYYQAGTIHFNVSMWEAQSETTPMIRPLFSIKYPQEYIGVGKNFSEQGKKDVQESISLISLIVSGCARDSYMLMTQGLDPTFPLYLKNNPDIVNKLIKSENREVCEFLLNEYHSAKSLLGGRECVSKLLTKEEMNTLATKAEMAKQAICELIK